MSKVATQDIPLRTRSDDLDIEPETLRKAGRISGEVGKDTLIALLAMAGGAKLAGMGMNPGIRAIMLRAQLPKGPFPRSATIEQLVRGASRRASTAKRLAISGRETSETLRYPAVLAKGLSKRSSNLEQALRFMIGAGHRVP